MIYRNYLSGPGFRSESLHQQARKVRKNLILNVLRLLNDLLTLKTDVNVPYVPTENTISKKTYFLFAS
jgi:hypothetical protein